MRYSIILLIASLLSIIGGGGSALAARQSERGEAAAKVLSSREQARVSEVASILESGKFKINDYALFDYQTSYGVAEVVYDYTYSYNTTAPDCKVHYIDRDTVANRLSVIMGSGPSELTDITLDCSTGLVYVNQLFASEPVPERVYHYSSVEPYYTDAQIARFESRTRSRKILAAYDLLQSGRFRLKMSAPYDEMLGEYAHGYDRSDKTVFTVNHSDSAIRLLWVERDTTAMIYTALYLTDTASNAYRKVTYDYYTGSLRLDSFMGGDLGVVQIGNHRHVRPHPDDPKRPPRRYDPQRRVSVWATLRD